MLSRFGDRRWQSRNLPEPVRRLPVTERAAVARAVRKCVPPADPALDEPTLALSAFARRQIHRYGWMYLGTPVAALVMSAAMLIASHDKQTLGTAAILVGAAIVTPASAVRRLERLERLESAIRTGGQDGPPTPRRRVRVPSPATAAVTAGIMVVASGLWLQWDARHNRPDWRLYGPHGAFPAAIAAQAPQHPRFVMMTYPFDVLTYRGIVIRAARNSGSVAAYGVRPFTIYWRLTRRDHRLVDADLDPSTGRLLTVWAHVDHDTDDTDAPMTAMMLDVRTGKVRWDRTVPGDPVVLGRGSSSIGRVVAIPAYQDVSVLDPATGHRRWRLRDRCEEGAGGTIGTTLILRRECPGTGLLLEGYDAATGRRLWSKSFASWWPGRDLARELPVKVDALDRNRMVVWTLEREAVYDATTGAQLGEHRQPIDGDGKIFDAETGYGPCRIHSDRDHRDGICATDPVSGRRLWSFPFPGADETTQLRSPMAVADGRVYTLTSDHGGEIVDHVDVNDARTGALLARVSPAFPRPGRLYGIQSTAGGALVLNDSLTPASTPHKTVVLGDE
ncbi:hypothetical protein GCM10009727_51050 [Actinomadura napierensis]|uniref:Pyrrolo-quinoline quinone repeat domain-containing protein n=2 Tax=Actinomadura napierensis TaxID=267854 RepID=A0ABN2ZV89_9ACTN